MKHYKHMKISTDDIKIYQKCENCTDVELTLHHVINCPVVAAAMHCLDHPLDEALYFDQSISIVQIVMKYIGI